MQQLPKVTELGNHQVTLLDKIFYDHKVMPNVETLYNSAKHLGFSRSQIQHYYDNQAIVQIFAPVKKYKSIPITRLVPMNRVYVDTMFMDQYAIVCIVDAFSRFGWAVAYKKPIDSRKALKALQSFTIQINKLGYKEITEVRTDVGAEFHNEFTKFLGDKATKTMPYAKSESGLIERFNGTVRRMLEKLMAVQGKPVDWIHRYLPRVLTTYNNTPHSATGQTPFQVLTSKRVKNEAVSALRSRLHKALSKLDEEEEIIQGDHVRLLVRDLTNVFDQKIGQNYSVDVYKVEKYDSKNRRYFVDGKWYKKSYLMKIDMDNLMGQERLKGKSVKGETKKKEVAQARPGGLVTEVLKPREPSEAFVPRHSKRIAVIGRARIDPKTHEIIRGSLR